MQSGGELRWLLCYCVACGHCKDSCKLFTPTCTGPAPSCTSCVALFSILNSETFDTLHLVFSLVVFTQKNYPDEPCFSLYIRHLNVDNA